MFRVNACGKRCAARAFGCFLALLCALSGAAFPLCGADTLRTALYVAPIGGEPLYDLNADMPLIPASVTKCVTTASVLLLGDPDERFTTAVVARGKLGGDGVLQGDIVVLPSGDPTLESAFFPDYSGFADSVCAAVASAGITRVAGQIKVETPAGSDDGVPPGWSTADLRRPYGAGWRPLNFRDNSFVLRLPSGMAEPAVPGVSVEQARGKKFAVAYDPASLTFSVTGAAPSRGWADEFANPVPGATLAAEITEKLRQHGVPVEGHGLNPRGGQLIYTHLSPTHYDIMASLMSRSDNMYAEAMLRSLAPGRSRQDALDAEGELWKLPAGCRLFDGSGLSRDDRLTARALAGALADMAGDDYAALFPRAGQEGTVKNLFKGSPLSGRLVLKSGSMNGVQSWAGYLLDAQGQPQCVVVMMANGVRDRARLKTSFEKLLEQVFADDVAGD